MHTIPDWNRLKIFYLTAEAKSFSAAAEREGLSQSSISRQIAALENEIGSPVFHRHTRGLALTEQGELLYDTARDIYKRISETEDLLISGRQETKGTLKVTTTHSFGSLWLSPLMPIFAKKYPDIQIDLILDDNSCDLAMREADIAVRMWQPNEPNLIAETFLRVQCNYYASEEYIKEMGEPETAEELDNHRLIAFSAPVLGLRDGLNIHLTVARSSQKNKRQAVFSANNLRSVFHAAEAGIGIASLPDYMTAKVARLKRILCDTPNTSFQTYIVYPTELKNTKRILVFRDFLQESAYGWRY